MDAERKMICTMVESKPGGVSTAVLGSENDGMPQEVTIVGWVLDKGQTWKEGAIYGVAVWWIADGPARA